LTDDGSSAISVPVSRNHAASATLSATQARVVQHRSRHQAPRMAAVLSSDDGIDSPTYDGDIESSSTLIARNSASNVSTPLASPSFTATSSAERPLPSLVLSQPTETSSEPQPVEEPEAPPPVIAAKFNPASLAPEDIQAFVNDAITGTSPRQYAINPPPVGRPIRIYADGKTTS